MDPSFLSRNVFEGFSGGEKKRNEILQMAVLAPEMIILDEIDSGLDIDALRDVTQTLKCLKRGKTSMVIITHYKRLLEYIKPDYIHIIQDGSIVKVGGTEIVESLEDEGYAAI
jgi:Fe-S cluster assembly ATP-binding protein